MNVACFISPHGYGHAARASAIMSAMHEIDPGVCFEIFTAVPQRFFSESLNGPYTYHHLMTDIGLVQKDPFSQDLVETVNRLDRFLPFDPEQIRILAEQVRSCSCRAVLCDISPMGIAVARSAGVPSILIENFTWDWIYEDYLATNTEFARHVAYLRRMFSEADYRIQAEPVCQGVDADLRTRPISRKPRTPAPKIRHLLGIPPDARTVIATMGGIPFKYGFEDSLPSNNSLYIIVPGAAKTIKKEGNVLLLPHFSGFYHPDLINACDAVIGKAGYSTLAETDYAGLPFGYIPRADFRESPVLEAFIRDHMAGMRLSGTDFQNGRWTTRLNGLLALPAFSGRKSNGADQAAAFICDLIATPSPNDYSAVSPAGLKGEPAG